jgi:FkbM family methyltransferase
MSADIVGGSIPYKSRFDRIVIFEPFPLNAEAIERNISLSGANSKMNVVRAADAERSGRASLFLSNDDTHSLQPKEELPSIEVDVVTLDATIDNLGFRHWDVRLIEIDVEGAEVAVLEGATRIIERGRPIISAEANSPKERESLLDHLSGLGYALHAEADHRNLVFYQQQRCSFVD